MEGFKELEGEKQHLSAEATFARDKALGFAGKLVVTNYRLQFVPESKRCCYLCRLPDKYLLVPLGVISTCDETVDKKKGITCIDIGTKDGRRLKFILSASEVFPTASTVTRLIKACAFPASEKNSFAFAYRPFKERKSRYDATSELERMKIGEDSPFRIYEDHIFTKAETFYPAKLIVPKVLLNKEIKAAAKLWTSRRFPVLSYYSKRHSASLWRSANFSKVT
eukprot:TRINITY_DN13179_c0_g1_i1.p2 TRINITY_DN13179_c0_g1~~TRINITY_DN13179_c0_g1_i1.p2  ORF type:complete len:223 (+),score=30.21 TRINITY_DN13179_c0_g1_i1:382-1050(+)